MPSIHWTLLYVQNINTKKALQHSLLDFIIFYSNTLSKNLYCIIIKALLCLETKNIPKILFQLVPKSNEPKFCCCKRCLKKSRIWETLNLLAYVVSSTDTIQIEKNIAKKINLKNKNHVSPVTCHISCVTCHMLRVTCHLSRVTNINSHSQRTSPFNSSTMLCRVVYIYHKTIFFLQNSTQLLKSSNKKLSF